jgi:hypothetical protein
VPGYECRPPAYVHPAHCVTVSRATCHIIVLTIVGDEMPAAIDPTFAAMNRVVRHRRIWLKARWCPEPEMRRRLNALPSSSIHERRRRARREPTPRYTRASASDSQYAA